MAQTISANRWKKRILLVLAPAATDPNFKRQQELLATVPDQLKERDFLVLGLFDNQLTATDRRYLQQEMKLRSSGFAVVLIGKDGGVKRTETQPLAPADLFGTVDKMPMRQQEARRK